MALQHCSRAALLLSACAYGVSLCSLTQLLNHLSCLLFLCWCLTFSRPCLQKQALQLCQVWWPPAKAVYFSHEVAAGVEDFLLHPQLQRQHLSAVSSHAFARHRWVDGWLGPGIGQSIQVWGLLLCRCWYGGWCNVRQVEPYASQVHVPVMTHQLRCQGLPQQHAEIFRFAPCSSDVMSQAFLLRG